MAIRSLDTLRPLTPCALASEFQEPVSLCRVCGRDVLDLSTFTREEAARLLSTSVPPCVRFVLRDGKPVFRKVVAAAAVAGLVGAAALARANAPSRQVPGPETRPPIIDRMTGGEIAPGQDWK